MPFTCGHCTGVHAEAATARACADPTKVVDGCGWLVETWPVWEDPDTGQAEWAEEAVIVACGAPAVHSDRGWYCEAGHEYTNMQTRHDEGWEYAEDEQEAKALAAAGVDPVMV